MRVPPERPEQQVLLVKRARLARQAQQGPCSLDLVIRVLYLLFTICHLPVIRRVMLISFLVRNPTNGRDPLCLEWDSLAKRWLSCGFGSDGAYGRYWSHWRVRSNWANGFWSDRRDWYNWSYR